MSTTHYEDRDDYYWERRWRDRFEDLRRRERGFPWGVFFVGFVIGAIIF